MRAASLLIPFAVGFCAAPALSQLVLPNVLGRKSSDLRPKDQSPMMPLPNIIPLPGGQDRGDAAPEGRITISDMIGKERGTNIFAGFTRDIDSVSERLDNVNQNSTVLTPLNSELTKLPRKPWEDPREYSALGSNAYEGKAGEDRAHRNLRRFVEAHVVPVSPWKEGEKTKSLGGDVVWWESKDGKKFIHPGHLEVASTSAVANGEVWVLKGVMNYSP